ncbi:MAG: hypothetical protein KDA05_03675 [Phycisphaerales bacterium]|nr:hypothetical protein [Phycisphaerales bacterium]MCB9841261.1 hypothetical protein [Phycisphaeraceae bacterium]
MAGRSHRRDPDDFAGLDDIDPDGPSREDLEKFGDEFVTCPECGSLVYDQAEVCQSCGRALEAEEQGIPMWAIVAGALVVAAFVGAWIIW